MAGVWADGLGRRQAAEDLMERVLASASEMVRDLEEEDCQVVVGVSIRYGERESQVVRREVRSRGL
jgi:hypothetical protein